MQKEGGQPHIHKATSTVIDALREELRSSFVPVQASILSMGRDQHGVNSKLEAVLHWWQTAHDKHVGHVRVGGLDSVDGKPRPGMTPSILADIAARRASFKRYRQKLITKREYNAVRDRVRKTWKRHCRKHDRETAAKINALSRKKKKSQDDHRQLQSALQAAMGTSKKRTAPHVYQPPCMSEPGELTNTARDTAQAHRHSLADIGGHETGATAAERELSSSWTPTADTALPPQPTALVNDGSICRVFTDGGARPNPGRGGAGYTIAKGVFATHKQCGCKRKQTNVCKCGIDWTEHVRYSRSVYIGEMVTNNECEWAARHVQSC